MKLFLSNALNLLNRCGLGETFGFVPEVCEELTVTHSIQERLLEQVSRACRRSQSWYFGQQRPEGFWQRLGSQSRSTPVCDTALTGHALISTGVSREHSALMRAASWLASRQDLPAGGWTSCTGNARYPGVDDSAAVLLLLRPFAHLSVISRDNLYRGLNRVLGMQGGDGGWGDFDADNEMQVLNRSLFSRQKAMIDSSGTHHTGRVLEMLGSFGYGLPNEVVRRAVRFIRRSQAKDGSWPGSRGISSLYGTRAVLTGLQSIGEDLSLPYIRKAVKWLKSSQNIDGGWGEPSDSRRTSTRSFPASTASLTAWALLALMAAGESGSEVLNGIAWLLERQNNDGTWDENEHTGPQRDPAWYPLLALGKFHATYKGRGNGT